MTGRIVACVCILVVMCSLAGCGSSSQSGGGSGTSASEQKPYGSSANYVQVIEDARDAELNDLALYSVVTSPKDARFDIVFSESYGFEMADMERYALSNPGTLTLTYAVGIILPVNGKEEQVLQQVNAFVEMRKKAMQNYLQDQYEIAAAAIVKTAPTGEILVAMCEDAPQVMAALEAGLAG